ncbi:hypothetical protein [Streptomyces mirabilis]|uniref:hypothetical protein n=1 Tax=Streptomyces mirabilis TaxID=68239 RepID=UPI0036803A21
MRLLATDAAHRAHALLNALTSPSGRTIAPGLMMPTNPKADAARLAAHHDLHIPLRRRLQQTLGMSKDELAPAVDSSHRPSTSE